MLKDYHKLLAAVVGPGHSLNELTNRVVNNLLGVLDTERWEMYPGHLGLYARHCDFYGIDTLSELYYSYRDEVRTPGEITQNHDSYTTENFDKFVKLLMKYEPRRDCGFYFNMFDHSRVLEDLQGWPVFTTRMNLKDSKNRHHYLMMEFSQGSTHDLYIYDHENQLEMLCNRLDKKHGSESEMMENMPSGIQIVNSDDLLAGDYSVLISHMSKCFDNMGRDIPEFHEELAKLEIEKYKFINQCSNKLLQQINEMSWDDIVAIAENSATHDYYSGVDKYGNRTN